MYVSKTEYAPEDFDNYLALQLFFVSYLALHDDGYSRNVSFPLNSIYTCLFDLNKHKLILS